jgi:hypothetical protein
MTHTPLTARHCERRSIVARAAILLLSAALMGVAGCGADRATQPGTDPNANPNQTPDPSGMPPGVRELINIDRVELPATIYSGPASDTQGRNYDQVTIVVTRGSMEFVSAERFAMTFDLMITADGSVSTKSLYIEGTYQMQVPVFKFHPTNGLDRDFGGSRGNGVVTVHVDLVGSGEANYYNFD